MNTTNELESAIRNTRQPELTLAVLNQLGGIDDELPGTLEDIASHSADAGWVGFTYYSDTLAFFKANKRAIMKRLEEDADNFGQDVLEMVARFGCLKDLHLAPYEISEAMNGRGGDAEFVQNALAWYALEEIAHELTNA